MNCLIRIRQRYAGFAQVTKSWRIIYFPSPIARDTSAPSSWQAKPG